MMYDCTPPIEPVRHAIVRHVHNLFHPRHRVAYAPPPEGPPPGGWTDEPNLDGSQEP
jgi:hypothetical protein